MTSCKFTRQCQDYFQGLLSTIEADLFREHLFRGCTTCQRELERLDKLKHALQAIEVPSLPEGLSQRTLQLVLTEMDRVPEKTLRTYWRESLSIISERWKVFVPVTAALTLLLTVYLTGTGLFSTHQETHIYSLAHLRHEELQPSFEDHFLSFSDVRGRERMEVNEVLVQLNSEAPAIADDATLIHSIDLSQQQNQIRPSTVMFLDFSDGEND
ncbi:hypothetical protein JXQ70_19175 [bacterium]|nr:hypothetical protein [bacterium]